MRCAAGDCCRRRADVAVHAGVVVVVYCSQHGVEILAAVEGTRLAPLRRPSGPVTIRPRGA